VYGFNDSAHAAKSISAAALNSNQYAVRVRGIGWQVNIRRVHAGKIGGANVFRDTDHFKPSVELPGKFHVQIEPPSQRIFARPKLTRAGFADDSHVRAVFRFLARKSASAENGNAQGGEITRRHMIGERSQNSAIGRAGIILGHDWRRPRAPEWVPLDQSRTLDLGQVFEALENLFLEGASLGLVGSEIAQDHERTSGIEPRIRGLRAQQSSHEQTRGNQEQHGNGDLPAYQKTTQA